MEVARTTILNWLKNVKIDNADQPSPKPRHDPCGNEASFNIFQHFSPFFTIFQLGQFDPS
jgi:hypothetical protein